MSGAGTQFGLLLWKNWLLQSRSKVATVFEIGLPTLLTIVLFIIRQEVEFETYPQPSTWPAFSVDKFDRDFLPPSEQLQPGVLLGKWQLAYTPDHPAMARIMDRVSQMLNVSTMGPTLEMTDQMSLAFATEEEMLTHVSTETIATLDILGGIVFTSPFPADGTLPKDIKYKIRIRKNGGSWQTSSVFPRSLSFGPRSNDSETGGEPGYFDDGFLAVQRALDLAIIADLNNTATTEDVIVQLQRFPYPPYTFDPFVFVLTFQFPFFILLSFIVAAVCIVKDVVLEKERKLKESMKMMGLSNWLHWTAWFVKYLMFLTISVVIITIFLKLNIGRGAVLTHSDGTLVFVFLMLYAITSILFCFMIAVFFSKANSGAAGGFIIFFGTYVPYFFLGGDNYDNLPLPGKMAACLLSNTAMALGCKTLSNYEASGVGMGWTNFYKPVTVDDDFSLGHVFVMLLIDCLWYSLVTWFVDAVFPGEYGIPKRWYFAFTKSYWCGVGSSDVAPIGGEDGEEDKMNSDIYEPNPPNLTPGIKIRKLRKEFKRNGTTLTAVNDLSLDMFEGQITALLGHNGAGKSTTMFMLTGFLPPTNGTACIDGHDIRTHMDTIRSSMGLCPQHDVLFDSLTVKEHLVFFAKLKGVKGSAVKEEVKKMIEILHLEKKTNAPSRSLSGGMKRKLSVGIALIGGSKIVILDEPTSGMDPEARRQTWDILQSQRAGRTLLLSTHFMDEADILADRIAIMAAGKVQCCGSSLFLKAKYGVGYHLVLVKSSPQCDVATITRLVTEHVPAAHMESHVSAELTYTLPSDSVASFQALFTVLEEKRVELGIDSFGASVTTMEEVFVKVGESVDEGLEARLQPQSPTPAPAANGTEGFSNKAFTEENGHSNKQGSAPAPSSARRVERVTGCALYMKQFRGMMEKRVLYSWRGRAVVIAQILVPLFFTIISCLLIRTFDSRADDEPVRVLATSMFEEPTVPYSHEASRSSAIANVFRDVIKGQTTSETVPEPGMDYMESYLVNKSEASLESYIRNYVAAATFEDDPTDGTVLFTGWFNNEAFHTPAVTLSLLGNTLLDYFVTSADHSIEVTNHPLPLTTSQQSSQNLFTSASAGFMVSYNITFGMAFLVATFVLFLVRERVVKAKHCQYLSGVHTLTFWSSTFTWDVINFLIPSACIIIVLAVFRVSAYVDGENLGITILIFVLYAWSVLPLVYLFSFLFNVPATAYVALSALNIFIGTAAVLAVQILTIPDLDLVEVGEILEWIFLILLPNFCFENSLQLLYTNYETLKLCQSLDGMEIAGEPVSIEMYCLGVEAINTTNPCCPGNCGDECAIIDENSLAWDKPGIGRYLFFAMLQGFMFFALLLFSESGLASRLKQSIILGTRSAQQGEKKSDAVPLQRRASVVVTEDDDVAAERERLAATNLTDARRDHSLMLLGVQKWYGNFLAVDKLSVGIPPGECFGLLGVNGAGKTTTFKMLTGDESISGGHAYLEGYSVTSNIKEVQQRVGYCPQFDALVDHMTVQEILRMYARLRGVPESDIPNTVNKLITSLLLEDHVGKLCHTLSGGNKRKVSTAIALIGEPPVVFLDEPTTGMDPVARRLLWDTLSQIRASGRTLVLTSHSMEECEALCTRLAIMVNGQFRCLGSVQQLKTKFGEGYTLMAKVKGGDPYIEAGEALASNSTEMRLQNFMGFIESEFPGSKVKDVHQGLVHYQILGGDGSGSGKVSWAQLFGTMEGARELYHLEDYSVSQTTLEQVFINFARAQLPPGEESLKCGTKTANCCRFFCCCGCCKV